MTAFAYAATSASLEADGQQRVASAVERLLLAARAYCRALGLSFPSHAMPPVARSASRHRSSDY